jgi:hypothetical protein
MMEEVGATERVARRRGFSAMPRPYDQCIRCGTPVGWGRSTCKSCNPAGLPEPSPAQFHATVFLTIIATVVLLGVIGLLLN